MLMQRQLRWIGHAIHDPTVFLPVSCMVSYSPGGQKKRFSLLLKLVLKCCHIPQNSLRLATDRQFW